MFLWRWSAWFQACFGLGLCSNSYQVICAKDEEIPISIPVQRFIHWLVLETDHAVKTIKNLFPSVSFRAPVLAVVTVFGILAVLFVILYYSPIPFLYEAISKRREDLTEVDGVMGWWGKCTFRLLACSFLPELSPTSPFTQFHFLAL